MEMTTLELFEEELTKIFKKNNTSISSQLYKDVLKEVSELYEGVTSVKNMVIEGVTERAEEAERARERTLKAKKQ